MTPEQIQMLDDLLAEMNPKVTAPVSSNASEKEKKVPDQNKEQQQLTPGTMIQQPVENQQQAVQSIQEALNAPSQKEGGTETFEQPKPSPENKDAEMQENEKKDEEKKEDKKEAQATAENEDLAKKNEDEKMEIDENKADKDK